MASQQSTTEITIVIPYTPQPDKKFWTDTFSHHTRQLQRATHAEIAPYIQTFSYRASALSPSAWSQIKGDRDLTHAFSSFTAAMSQFLRACRNLCTVSVVCAYLNRDVASALQALPPLKSMHLTSTRIDWDISSHLLKVTTLSVDSPEESSDRRPSLPCPFSGETLVSLDARDDHCMQELLGHLRQEHARLGSLSLVQLHVEINESTIGPVVMVLPLCTRLQRLEIDDYRSRHPEELQPLPFLHPSSLPQLRSYSGPSDVAKIIVALHSPVRHLTISSTAERTTDAISVLSQLRPGSESPQRPKVSLLQLFTLEEFPWAIQAAMQCLDRVETLCLRFLAHGVPIHSLPKHLGAQWRADQFPGIYLCDVLKGPHRQISVGFN